MIPLEQQRYKKARTLFQRHSLASKLLLACSLVPTAGREVCPRLWQVVLIKKLRKKVHPWQQKGSNMETKFGVIRRFKIEN